MKNSYLSTYKILLFLLILVFPLKLEAIELETGSSFLNKQYSKTISMEFNNAGLNNVLKIFSEQSGMNFIAETAVANKKVSLYFENVPVEEALERILSANNLTYEIKPGSNIFVVKDKMQPERTLISRVYNLKHIVLPSSNLATTIADTTKIADSKNGLLGTLRRLLSSKGSIIEDPRTNSIIVNDYPIQFPEIEKTIARLDVKIAQILIETEILDVSEGSVEAIGAKFNNTPLTINGPQKEILWPFNIDNVNEDIAPGGGDRTFGGASGYTAGSLNFPTGLVTLQFLKTQSDTKNLANPKILTMNNQTAEIEIETSEVVGITSQISDAGGASTTSAEREPTGITLKVTPQANLETGEIIIAVLPQATQVKRSQFVDGNGNAYQNPEKQSTKSVFRVKDGDTVIIGGLKRNKESETETKVPFLGDIPIIGRAFRHKSSENSQRELLVFITPHILKDDDTSNVFKQEPIDNRSLNISREQTPPIDLNISVNKNKISYMNK